MNDSEGTVTITIPNDIAYSYPDMSSVSGMTISDNIDISTITITGSSYNWATADTITFPDYNLTGYNNLTEFESCLPAIDKVKDMCNEYPALEKAYENFKLIYKLVNDDWESKLRGDNE